jgi:hypothetical protein
VRHSYFERGQARQLVFMPCAETAAALKRFGLVTQSGGSNLAIHAPGERLPGLWSENRADAVPLNFQLYSTDPLCAVYTAPDNPALPAVFGPQPGSSGQLMPVGATKPAIRMPLRPGMLLGQIHVPLPTADTYATWLAGLGVTWQLQFSARSTIWKYFLLGDWQDHSLQMVDAQGVIEFSPPSPDVLQNGRPVTVIRSLTNITLQDRPLQRFQLRDTSSTPPRVLVPRMPAATPSALGREQQAGTTTVVSEIFLSR